MTWISRGAPLRQTMNFDLYNDDNSLASHNTIVSQGALARNHTDGDLTARQRFRLVVTAQQGAIRLGGYYEIEVKGAVTFDGPTLGVGVRPIAGRRGNGCASGSTGASNRAVGCSGRIGAYARLAASR